VGHRLGEEGGGGRGAAKWGEGGVRESGAGLAAAIFGGQLPVGFGV